MAKSDYESQFNLCPKFQKTFSILGRKWNGLILEVLISEGPQRFKEISEKVSKCSDRVLVERLKELEEEKLVEKVPSNTCRNMYQLTPRGEDLKAVMDSIHDWADKWYSLEDCK
ncbi:winged helix-turn-helix transcriptional regulator [Ligilactobacillus sp. LYQ135]